MILALHGNLGSTEDWESLDIPDLRAVDLWEHSHRSLEGFAEMISETDERPILAGYSLGGRLALHAMAAYPDRWRGAVIVSTHPGLSTKEERVARCVSDGLWAKRARDLEWSEFLERWNSQSVLANSPEAGDQSALESKRKEIALAFENWSLGKQKNLRRELGAFTKPVLWITGERDQKFTALGEEMSAVFPDIRHEIIRDCGHRVLLEQPDRLREIVAEFVRTARISE